MNELVQKLTQEQPIVASLRPEPTLDQLKASVERNYVLIKFTETRGGTELGIRLDQERSDLTAANFAAGTGRLRIVGELVLDYVPVRFHGHIDLESLAGTGRLEILSPPSDDATPGSSATGLVVDFRNRTHRKLEKEDCMKGLLSKPLRDRVSPRAPAPSSPAPNCHGSGSRPSKKRADLAA